MPRYQIFFNQILELRKFNQYKNIVKVIIGDSNHNNRTLTVNQIIRFAEESKHIKYNKFAKQLEVVYNFLRPEISLVRYSDGVKRTDAIDINEFVDVYREVVMNNRQHRQTIGTLISKVS